MKRLLTIGHSYVVAANRQLAHQMAVQGGDEWEVTVVAPRRFRGDLRQIEVEPIAGEKSTLRAVPVRLDRVPHLMWYGDGAREILASGWDVVHCWEEPYTRSAARIARAIPARTKLVVASFQNIAKRYPWPLRAYERQTMKRANGWIAFGETVHDTLKDRPGYADTPGRVIPPGVDLDRFHSDPHLRRAIRDRLGCPADAVVVGYLGRFVEAKGLDTLMQAVAAPLRDGRCHVLLVGGGELESRLRAFAATHPGRVHVQTGVPHDEVPAWLNAMDILAAPTRSTPRWREQFGRMLIEAMACGVAVAASDSGEIPVVIGDAGIVVGEDDVDGWQRAIGGLIDDGAARQSYARRGEARARERYGWALVARQHLAFFDEVLHA
jgi:glycosyltransferase involved in cell wall biosynthesis